MNFESGQVKRILRSLLSLIAVAGVMYAIWPLGQNAYAWWSQRTLHANWPEKAAKNAQSAVKQAGNKAHKGQKSSSLIVQTGNKPAIQNPKPAIKWPPTRLIIPSVGLDVVVVDGFDDESLKRGPGYYPRSALPGQPGNCIIAGHRNVYGSWFSQVPDLEQGTEIKLRTPDETFTYKVLLSQLVSAMDTTIFRPTPPDAPRRLELLTCTVPHSPDRIMVIAEMEPANSPY